MGKKNKHGKEKNKERHHMVVAILLNEKSIRQDYLQNKRY
jgi:hypothetical protein